MVALTRLLNVSIDQPEAWQGSLTLGTIEGVIMCQINGSSMTSFANIMLLQLTKCYCVSVCMKQTLYCCGACIYFTTPMKVTISPYRDINPRTQDLAFRWLSLYSVFDMVKRTHFCEKKSTTITSLPLHHRSLLHYWPGHYISLHHWDSADDLCRLCIIILNHIVH